jgi:pantothenate kinase type III
MILVVDVGNTRIKAVFEGNILLQHFVFGWRASKNIKNILKIFTNTGCLVVASVGNIEKSLLEFEKR